MNEYFITDPPEGSEEVPYPGEIEVHTWLKIDGIKGNWNVNLNLAQCLGLRVDPLHQDIAFLLSEIVKDDSENAIRNYLWNRHRILPRTGITLADLQQLLVQDGTTPNELSDRDNSQTTEPGYLELTIDYENRVVRRFGEQFVAIVQLGSSDGLWHIFIRLFEAGANGTTKEAVMNGYPGDTGPAFHQACSELNGRLKVLCVGKEPRKYRLINTSETS